MVEEETTLANEFAATPQSLALRDIASWHGITEVSGRTKINARIPVLQRGLVWDPEQIELLWDSLLRGFPIGALVLVPRIRNQDKATDREARNVTHHVLDGQQRCDAIALGFKDPFAKETGAGRPSAATSILWLDLDPVRDQWSTREFLVRLTTTAHPWGYERNDDATPLKAWQVRQVLERVGLDPRAENYQRPTPVELFPGAANVPVPLSWLLLATSEDHTGFWKAIAARLSGNLPWHHAALEFTHDPRFEEQRSRIWEAVRRTESAHIACAMAPADLTERSRQEGERGEGDTEIANIEHLFQRLNRQGTKLDGEELAYSMIKAYWPELAAPVDAIASKLFPASRLISIGIRAALAEESARRLPAPMSVSAIRKMAGAGDKRTELVHSYIQAELGKACEAVEKSLRYELQSNPSGLLPVHVASIAQRSPEMFLLLLTWVRRPASAWQQAVDTREWPRRLQAVASLVHWFAHDQSAVTHRLFVACAGGIHLDSIRDALTEAVKAGELIGIHPPDTVDAFLSIPCADWAEWRWWKLTEQEPTDEAKERMRAKWTDFLGVFRGNREMLLYAQRDFVNRRFQYDPARKDFWKAHNRPWDFDHILAWSRVNNRKDGSLFTTVVKEWAGTIGNLRAWPFEDNRSEQADPANSKLRGDARLLEASFMTGAEEAAFSRGDEARWNMEALKPYIENCRGRLVRIYRHWYETLRIEELVLADGKSSVE